MRALLYILSAVAVMGLAFWAYKENYRTKAALDEMDDVRQEIAILREAVGVQRAEWAFLNRPDRLRELVDINFERLKLLPLSAIQFAKVQQVAYPVPPAEPDPSEVH